MDKVLGDLISGLDATIVVGLVIIGFGIQLLIHLRRQKNFSLILAIFLFFGLGFLLKEEGIVTPYDSKILCLVAFVLTLYVALTSLIKPAKKKRKINKNNRLSKNKKAKKAKKKSKT